MPGSLPEGRGFDSRTGWGSHTVASITHRLLVTRLSPMTVTMCIGAVPCAGASRYPVCTRFPCVPPSEVNWAASKALDELPSDISWALRMALGELPSVVNWARRKVLDELPSVVVWAPMTALNELPPLVR